MRARMRALWGLVLGGCTAGSPPAEAPDQDVPAGWGQVVADRPDDVLALLTADEAGWAALHRGDLAAALSASPAVAARAQQDLTSTEAILVTLHTVAAVELAQTWSDRAGLPKGTALHTWAALAASDLGQPTAGLLALAPPPQEAGWAALHGALAGETDLASLAEQVPGPLGDCLAAHAKSREQGGGLPAGACPAPFLVEAGGARSFADPLAMRTRHLGNGAEPLRDGELSSILFSAAWGPQDVADPAAGPTASMLGLAQADTAEAVLVHIQSATAMLEGWRPQDGAPGARLSADLDVIGVYRAHLLTDWALARVSTPAASHEAFRALLDADAGRDLGPTHPPRMLAAEALSAVRAGHVRSALPSLRALAPLSTVLRELPALTELVNDLQVAATLGRSGDSKEP